MLHPDAPGEPTASQALALARVWLDGAAGSALVQQRAEALLRASPEANRARSALLR